MIAWYGRVAVLVVLLVAGAVLLLDLGTRGAEIATVLALLVAVVGIFAELKLFRPLPRSKQPKPPRSPGQLAPSWSRAVLDWGRGYSRAFVGLFLLLFLALSLVMTSRFWAGALYVLVAGCEHPIELRVLTSQEQLEPAQQLAAQYQRSTQRFGCESVHPYVFPLSTRQARQTLVTGWPDATLKDAGPRPDVWLADSGKEVTQVKTELLNVGGGGKILAEDVLARSPIVLGVPAANAKELQDELSGRSWSEMFQATKRLDWDMVRPDPTSSPAGEFGTALLYGGRSTVELELARSIEQRVDLSLDHGKYPIGGSLDVLCRYRQLDPQRTAVVISEQALVRFNNGDACGQRHGQCNSNDLLLAYYPSDTRSLDLRFVRFDWSAPPQAEAAAEFREWLGSKDGAQALANVGLRQSGLIEGGWLPDCGVQQDAIFNLDLVPDDVLTATMALHQTAQRRSRVLFALDSSGSMAAPAGTGQGSRFTVASHGVVGALKLMGGRDEFGLWVFPAAPLSSEVREAVTIGPRDDLVGTQPRPSAVDVALKDIQPGGGTPLYRAIVDGVVAVGPSTEKYSSAFAVLTDGENTTSGLSDAQVIDAVIGQSVRVFVIAVGEAGCTPVLEDITNPTGGKCLKADLSSIDVTLNDLFSTLWNKD